MAMRRTGHERKHHAAYSLLVSFPMCDITNDQGRDHDGDCRLNTFDGLPHGTSTGGSPATSISGHVQSGLASVQQQFPTEDWGYFLNADGSVRWSDVAFSACHTAQRRPR